MDINNFIVDIKGKKFFKQRSTDELIEICDFQEPEENLLTAFSYIYKKDEDYYWGENHVRYYKKWGCVNAKHEIVIKCIFDKIEFSNLIIIGYIKNPSFGYTQCKFDLNGTPIYVDKDQNIVTYFEGWDYVEDFDGHPISLAKQKGKWGVVSFKGEVMIKPLYDSLKMEYDRWGKNTITFSYEIDKKTSQDIFFWDRKFTLKTPPEYSLFEYNHGLYVLYHKQDNNYTAMDKNGEVVIEKSENIEVDKDIVIITRNSKKGILDRSDLNGKLYNFMLPCIYDEIIIRNDSPVTPSNKFAMTIKDNLQGAFSLQEKKIIINPTIDRDKFLILSTISENSVAYENDKEWGFVNFEGNVLFSFEIKGSASMLGSKSGCRYYKGFSNGLVTIERNHQWETYDKKGNLIESKEIYSCNNEDFLFTDFHHEDACAEEDYREDTWDALTDGMYGDMPENFDGDYDFLG